MPTIQEQLNKIEKDFDGKFVYFSYDLRQYLDEWMHTKKPSHVKSFLHTSALELVKSVVEGIKGQEDLERLKETLKEI